MNHSVEHETWLLRIVAEPEAALPAERAAVAACDQCRELLAGLESTAARLDATGRTEQEFLAEALALDPSAAERATRTFVPPRPTPGAWRPGPITYAVLLAAAGVVLALFLWRGDPPKPPTWMGGRTLHLVAPRGPVESYGEFRWQGLERADVTYEVRIYAEAPDGTRSLHSRTTTPDTTWDPIRAGHPPLPPRIFWQVTPRDGTGPLPGDSVSSWCAPR